MNNTDFASSLALLFVAKQPSFEASRDILTAISNGTLLFTWDAARGSLIMNCATNKLATSLIWAHMDNSFAVAGRELGLKLIEIHAIDTGVTYDLCLRLMNTTLC